ncbi:MAG: sugar phosphate isomerase/epimerase [Planctomycetes bacterium]|nr:sugar phosphate isomerase/epimerase [Planctomycetota bacterium]
MRFGLNTFLTQANFGDTEMHLISEYASWGADIIELAINEPQAVDASLVAKTLKEVGIPAHLCAMFPPHRDLRGSEEEQKATLEYMTDMIELAPKVGARMILGPMYSSVGRCAHHSEEERDEQFALVAKHMKTLCSLAEERGVTLAIEPLNRFETDMINTLDQATRLIEMVASPNLKIHVDTFHMNIEEADSAQSIRKAGDLVGHFHASASHRGIPGKDQVHWKSIMKALKDIDYGGDIVIESFSMDNEIIARAAAIWIPRYDSAEKLAREGLAFLRKQWSEV